MNNILIRCDKCGKIYKIVKGDVENKIFYTDFNDALRMDNEYMLTCLNCGDRYKVLDNSKITEDWIASAVFNVKGK